MDDLLLYGVVGWDINAMDSVRAIKKAKGKAMSARINSPGGSVWEGLAIATAIREHGDVSTHVDGLAASMGSVLFVSGKTRSMARGSRLMIHNPSSMAAGEADDLRKEADVLDNIADDMAQMYADASGGKLSKERARELMDAETWFSADEAVAVGLADRVEGKAAAFAKIPASMHYTNIPEDIRMEDHTTEQKPSLVDRMLAALTPSSSVKAELDAARAELAEATGALTESVAKLAEANAALESAKAGHAAELERIAADHAKAIEAAKIEGAQEATAQMLKGNAPAPLPHAEPGEGEPTGTATERWNALRAAGRYEEAGKLYSEHRNTILEGK